MNEEQIIKEIEKAIAINSETDVLEFKDARSGFSGATVKKTLSAFGNTKGGTIVFGVHEKKDRTLEVVGAENIADLQERMAALSAEEMSEILRLDYHHITLQEKNILAVYVPQCANHTKPYHIKQLGMDKGAYVRDSNTDRQMAKEEVESYIRNAQADDFDGSCADDATIDELSFPKIENFLQESAQRAQRDFSPGVINEAVLKNIGIVKKCDGILSATIAGYLIFAKEKPQNKLQFERYKIRCSRFAGSSTASEIIDKADIGGTLDEQIDAMEAFVLRNIRNSAKIVGTKRVERYEYPRKAIREIVANAVIHRDYRIKGTYTQVHIFADRIEVFNPGNLPPGVTVENIKDVQQSRNQIISTRLSEMRYLEEKGLGINIVFDKMSEWKLLPPIFKNTSNSFKVILPGEPLSQLNERQIEIWQYLMDKKRVTSKKIKEILPGIPSATINYDLRKMIEVGLIHKMGESINTYYESSF